MYSPSSLSPSLSVLERIDLRVSLSERSYSWSVSLEFISGVIATTSGAAFLWPQVFRAYRRRSVQGLSPASNVVGLVGSVFWTVFGYSTGRSIAVIANVNVGVALALITVMLVRARVLNPYIPVVSFISTLAYCVTMSTISPQIVGITGLIVSTPAFLPQMWRAIRTKHLYGVSVWANMLFAVQCTFWVIYGIEVQEWLYIYPNAFLIPCALVIAWKVRQSRKTALTFADPSTT